MPNTSSPTFATASKSPCRIKDFNNDPRKTLKYTKKSSRSMCLQEDFLIR